MVEFWAKMVMVKGYDVEKVPVKYREAVKRYIKERTA